MALIPPTNSTVRAVVPDEAVYDQEADRRRFPQPGQGPAPEGGRNARGNQTLSGLMKAVDNVEVHNQHDLYEVLEAFRKLSTYVAAQAFCVAHEVNAGAKAMAKKEATLGIVGLNMRVRIRDVTKEVEGVAGHFIQASAGAIKARHKMEAILDEINGAQRPKQDKGFTIEVG